MNRFIQAAFIAAALASNAAAAEDSNDPYNLAVLDADGNGLCQSTGEIEAAAQRLTRARHETELRARHHGGDFHVDEAERKKVEAAIQRRVADYRIDLRNLLAGRDCIDPRDVTIAFVGAGDEDAPFSIGRRMPMTFKDGSKITFGGLLLRADHTDQSILKTKGDVALATGAQFSFTHEFGRSENTWVARGAVLYPLIYDGPAGCFGTSPVFIEKGAFVPSISFDRVESTRATEDASVLAFRAGSVLTICNGLSFGANYLAVNALYETDFDFQTGIAGVEAGWTPDGGFLRLNDPVFILDDFMSYRLTAVGYLVYGHVVDHGGSAELKAKDTFLRVGPELLLDVWIEEGVFKDLHAYVGWKTLFGVVGPNSEQQLFTAGLDYPLDKFGQLVLSLDYRRGEIALKGSEVDAVTLGFKVKF